MELSENNCRIKGYRVPKATIKRARHKRKLLINIIPFLEDIEKLSFVVFNFNDWQKKIRNPVPLIISSKIMIKIPLCGSLANE